MEDGKFAGIFIDDFELACSYRVAILRAMTQQRNEETRTLSHQFIHKITTFSYTPKSSIELIIDHAWTVIVWFDRHYCLISFFSVRKKQYCGSPFLFLPQTYWYIHKRVHTDSFVGPGCAYQAVKPRHTFTANAAADGLSINKTKYNN